MIGWRFTEQFIRYYPGIPQGLGEFCNVSVEALGTVLEGERQQAWQQIRAGATEVAENIAKYQRHFQLWGYECPLVKQHQRTIEKGLSKINPLVDLLLFLEMRFGILMGIHDLDRISGEIQYDCTPSGESFRGMRYQLLCKDHEFVIRDHEGIIASYFQGADNRTCISKNTRSIVLFAFGAPSIPSIFLERSLLAAKEIVQSFSSSTAIELR